MIDATRSAQQIAGEVLDNAVVRIVEMSSVVARVRVELPLSDLTGLTEAEPGSVAGLTEAGTGSPAPAADAPASDLGRWQLRGTIDGPHCQYASTLTAAVSLRPPVARSSSSDADDSLTCEAAIADPCFWTPQLPHRYRLKLELARGEEILARAERSIGLRPLSVRGRGFWFDGAGWVLRAAARTAIADAPLAAWRESSLAMVVDTPDDRLCEEAGRVGVLLVADISGSAGHLAAALRRLSRHAAVGLAIVTCDEPLDAAVRRAAGGILFVQRVGKALGATAGLPSSARPDPVPVVPHALLVDAGDPDQVAHVATASSLPVIIERAASVASPADARRACDRLQADLAGHGNIAGYLLRAVPS
ncbi:MAG: hypothetical protein AB7U73_11135 [Pirellulales bacterium]